MIQLVFAAADVVAATLVILIACPSDRARLARFIRARRAR
jgi:hypothetical protein